MGEEQTKSFLKSRGMRGWMLWLILILVVFNVLMLLPLMKYPGYREELAVIAEQAQNSGYESGYEEGFKEGHAQGLTECTSGGRAAFEIGVEQSPEKGVEVV